MATPDTIIDKIYEAAFVPDLWPSVLDEIADLSGTVGGVLFAVTPQVTTGPEPALGPALRWTASAPLVPVFSAFLEGGWMEQNIRGQRGFASGHAGFLTDYDVCTKDEIEHHPFYGFARQLGFGWMVGASIRVPTGDALLFNWERRYADGPVDAATVARLDPLRGHLARASLLATRLGLERANVAAATLGLLGLPAAVLSSRGSLLATNALLDQIMPDVVREGGNGVMRLTDVRAEKLFSGALARMHSGEDSLVGGGGTFSIPLPARANHLPMIVHLIPVRRSACDVFAAAASFVVVTPVSRANVPDANVIQGLFDLTPTEARVAHKIAAGESVRTIAATSQVSEGTVRVQLKAIFAKTGVGRQVDLVSLLGRLGPTTGANRQARPPKLPNTF